MGQAKLRGGFEVRKAESEVRQSAERVERENARLAASAAREAAMTPEQRQRKRKSGAMLAAIVGAMVGRSRSY